MKRFVSYLYSVYNNQKIHNAGFARIELRTGRNRIDIHLQENGYIGKSGTVYLFVRNQKNIQGIPIGNIIFRSSQADFRYERPEENIGQTSWKIMQMSGIVIQIEGRIAFLSQWDEEPVDTEKFEVWDLGQEDAKPSEEENLHEAAASQSAVNQEKPEQKSQHAVKQEKPEQKSQSAVNQEKIEQMAQTGRVQDGGLNHASKVQNRGILNNYNVYGEPQLNQTEENVFDMKQSGRTGNEAVNKLHPVQPNAAANKAPAQSNNSADKDQDAQTQTSTIHTAEITPQPQWNRTSWEQTWRYMLRMYPVMNQFAEEDNVLCVRIEIKDVRLLPEKYWSMVNNSFLLHGFFNYRYLVFGRIGQNWFIGIPGVYQNQEHVMASIFGFPDFLSQAEKNERGEQPGYWYRTLKI